MLRSNNSFIRSFVHSFIRSTSQRINESTNQRINESTNQRTNGLTLLEIVISLAIISIALVGIFQILNVGLMSVYKANDEIIATNLTRGLMSEIMSKAFVDPQDTANTERGINAGETLNDRTTYDDVDDYRGYSANPPRTIGNVVMNGQNNTPDCRNWTIVVPVVAYLDGNMNYTTVATDFKVVVLGVDSPRIPDVALVEVKAR